MTLLHLEQTRGAGEGNTGAGKIRKIKKHYGGKKGETNTRENRAAERQLTQQEHTKQIQAIRAERSLEVLSVQVKLVT